MNVVEITANVNGVIMRGEDYAPDLRKAFDKALKNIERQVKKHKSYLTDRARMKVQDVSFDIDPEIIAASAPEKEEPHEIVKRKKFSVDVMTPLEATMQMDLLGHSFFIFKNDETGEINVVYRREEGGYGLLEPQAAATISPSRAGGAFLYSAKLCGRAATCGSVRTASP